MDMQCNQVLEMPRTCFSGHWAQQPEQAYSEAMASQHVPPQVLLSSYHCCSVPRHFATC